MNKIKETLQELTNKIPDVKESFNFGMPQLEKLYNQVYPNITTENNSILYFNSLNNQSDNAFFMQVLDTYQTKSSTFANLINLRRNMLIGNGLKVVNQSDTAAKEFINKTNKFGLNLNDCWERMCFDYSLFEAYAVEVLFDDKGVIDQLIPIDLTTVRAVAPVNDIPYTSKYYISRNWANITNKYYKKMTAANSAVPIAVFNPLLFAADGGRQLLYVKRYNSGNNFYSIPSYLPALSYAELEYQLSEYHLNTVSKGFFPAAIINLPGNPAEEDKTLFINKFKSKYSGADKEKLLFIWGTDADQKPQIIPFDSSVTDNNIFQILNEITTQKIASAMGANLELAGIQTGNATLGGDANKLAVSYNYYYTSSILPMQKVMLEGINKIMRHNGLSEVTVVTPPLNLTNTTGQQAPVPSIIN